MTGCSACFCTGSGDSFDSGDSNTSNGHPQFGHSDRPGATNSSQSGQYWYPLTGLPQFGQIFDFIEINSSGKYCMVTLCDSIFSQMDTSLRTVYIDTDENVLADENDALMIINYDYSFETFYQSQLAIFLSCAEKIRLNEG